MTIRLRLTLVYSSILSLTLLIFGVILYTTQANDSLESLKEDLRMAADKTTGALINLNVEHPNRGNPPPRTFDEFTDEQAFQKVQEREVVRVLDPNGNLMASPFGNEEDALPISEDAIEVLNNFEEWYENGIYSESNMLIYNRPIVKDGELIVILQVARSQNERDRTLRSLATTLVIAGLITALTAFGIGWILSGLTLKPINRITQTAKSIGDDRDFTRRVNYLGPQDEVGQLASTFNQMLSSLQEAFQKIEQTLNLQRDFVADVSHELRTPLTTLRGNLGLMDNQATLPSEVQEDILADMVDESDRMIRLVNELLMMAHADARKSLMRERIKIQPIISEVCNHTKLLDTNRHIKYDHQGKLTILGDKDAFRQTMLILLDNAIKYSNDDVIITANQKDSIVEIVIRDWGEGIPAEDLDHIFDRFYRVEEEREISGFGLGLSIAKRLMEAMGGSIAIESELGKGSKAILRFPN